MKKHTSKTIHLSVMFALMSFAHANTTGVISTNNNVALSGGSIASSENGIAIGNNAVATGTFKTREDFQRSYDAYLQAQRQKLQLENSLNSLNNDSAALNSQKNSLTEQLSKARQIIGANENAIRKRQEIQAQIDKIVADNGLTDKYSEFTNYYNVLSSLDWTKYSETDGATKMREQLKEATAKLSPTIASQITDSKYDDYIRGYVNVETTVETVLNQMRQDGVKIKRNANGVTFNDNFGIVKELLDGKRDNLNFYEAKNQFKNNKVDSEYLNYLDNLNLERDLKSSQAVNFIEKHNENNPYAAILKKSTVNHGDMIITPRKNDGYDTFTYVDDMRWLRSGFEENSIKNYLSLTNTNRYPELVNAVVPSRINVSRGNSAYTISSGAQYYNPTEFIVGISNKTINPLLNEKTSDYQMFKQKAEQMIAFYDNIDTGVKSNVDVAQYKQALKPIYDNWVTGRDLVNLYNDIQTETDPTVKQQKQADYLNKLNAYRSPEHIQKMVDDYASERSQLSMKNPNSIKYTQEYQEFLKNGVKEYTDYVKRKEPDIIGYNRTDEYISKLEKPNDEIEKLKKQMPDEPKENPTTTDLENKIADTEKQLADKENEKTELEKELAKIDTNVPVKGKDSIAYGTNSFASGDNAIAFGTDAKAVGDNNIAIGKGATNTRTNGSNVAIGEGSEITDDYTFDHINNNPKFAGVLSVGSKDKQRVITNVFDGNVANDSTDAINGSQLFRVRNDLTNLQDQVYNLITNPPQSPQTTYGVKAIGMSSVTSVENVYGQEITTIDTKLDSEVTRMKITEKVEDEGSGPKRSYTFEGADVQGDSNIIASYDEPTNTHNLKLSKNLTADSLTVNDNGPSINKNGVDMKDKGITNLISGIDGNKYQDATDNNAASIGDVKRLASQSGKETQIKGGDGIEVSKDSQTGEYTVGLDMSYIPKFADGDNTTVTHDKATNTYRISAKTPKLKAGANTSVNYDATDNSYTISSTGGAGNVDISGDGYVSVDKDVNGAYKIKANTAKVKAGNYTRVTQDTTTNTFTVSSSKSVGKNAVEVSYDETQNQFDIGLNAETLQKVNNGQAAYETVTTKGLSFKTDSGTTYSYKLGDTMTISGDGKNIVTKTLPNGGVKVELSNNVKADTFTAGDNGPVLSKDGLDMKSKGIGNVASGIDGKIYGEKDDNNVANIGDVKRLATSGVVAEQVETNVMNKMENRFGDINNRIGELDNKYGRAIAASNALSSLPQSIYPGRSMISAGVGGYKNHQAVAVGFSRINDSGTMIIKMGAGANTKGKTELHYNASVGLMF